MQRSGSGVVHGARGLRGRLVEDGPADGDGRQALVQFDSGQRLLVPADALVLQQDGSYKLSIGLDELLRRGQTASGESSEKVVVPVVEEELEVHRRTVERGGVRVRKVVREHEESVDLPLMREELEVERVPVNRVIEGPVPVRQEGDTMVIPVLEEVLVVEKRLMLKEELRVTRRARVETESRTVTLRAEEAIVERLEPGREARAGRPPRNE